MSFAEHAVTAPAGEIALACLKISHPTWATVIRYVLDTRDWAIPGDGTYIATGLDVESAGTDDTGIDSRSVSVPDMDLTLWKRIERLGIDGNNVPITVVVTVYASTDLTTPIIPAASFKLANPVRDGRTVSFEASTVDTVNRDAPVYKFTWANSPGLRR